MKILTKEEIARRLEETLRDAVYLEMKGLVVQSLVYGRPEKVICGLEPIEFQSRMARDRLHCEVHKDGRLYIEFAWLNGRVQEHLPQPEGDPLIEYESPQPDGIAGLRSSAHLGCLFGTQMQTWVGPASERGPMFRERIENSEQRPDQEVGGRPCYVFKQTRTTCADEPLEHDHYVDQESFLLRRWDSLHCGIHRVRLYEPEVGEQIPEEIRWQITVGSV